MLLSPQSLQITAGEEKTIFCDVRDFYPQAINISWLVQKDGALHAVPLSSDICTGIPSAHGHDGLFSVLSRLTQVMNESNNGSLYICEVQHESLKKALQRNTTLFITSKNQFVFVSNGFWPGSSVGKRAAQQNSTVSKLYKQNFV